MGHVDEDISCNRCITLEIEFIQLLPKRESRACTDQCAPTCDIDQRTASSHATFIKRENYYHMRC